MADPIEESIRSGASHVDETEQLASGLSDPRVNPQEDIEDPALETELADLTLSMFTQGVIDEGSRRQRAQFVGVLRVVVRIGRCGQ